MINARSPESEPDADCGEVWLAREPVAKGIDVPGILCDAVAAVSWALVISVKSICVEVRI
jgi:hypothetical protein